MSVISLRCPDCGGNVELDDKRQFGFCVYCGTKIMIQEQMKQRYVLDNSDKIDSWIELSKSAILSRKVDDARKYADMVIEEDSGNKQAWFLKMCCSLMAENRTEEAKYCSKKCMGMTSKDLLDYMPILIDSIFYRFDSTAFDVGFSFGELDAYQDTIGKIISDLVLNSTDKEKAEVFYEFVMKLADCSIKMNNGYTKKIIAYIADDLFEILEKLGDDVYLPYSKELRIFHRMMDIIDDALETPDDVSSEDLIEAIEEISNDNQEIMELSDIAYANYSDEDDYASWKFLKEHPDIKKTLDNEMEDAVSTLIDAESRLLGRKRKIEEAKSTILVVFEKYKYPWKYYAA